MSGSRRILAQMVRYLGKVLNLAVVEWSEGECPRVYLLDRETHTTEFFNGLIVWLPEYVDVPQGVSAVNAAALAKELPEPTSWESAAMAMIPFVAD